MIRVLSVENMRKSDAAAIAAGTPGRELMGRAAGAVFDAYRWKGPAAIVCGSGNNAGDGYALALLLHEAGIVCTLVRLSEKLSQDGRFFYEKCVSAGVPEIRLWESGRAEGIFKGCSEIVDCIFGTGFKGAARGLAAEVIKEINSSGCFVISVDINSGLNGDNGLIGGTYPQMDDAVCVRSDLTVSIGDYKPGHFLGSAKDVIGSRINCDIGIEPADPPMWLVTDGDASAAIPPRLNLSNKGTYGYVTLIGGSARYSGAIRLAHLSQAALRSGAGVATAAVPSSIAPLITSHVLESTILPLPEEDGEIAFCPEILGEIAGRSSVICFGMGIGTGSGADRSLAWLLEHYSGRLIVDADGLTLLSRMPAKLVANAAPQLLLTPHVKEFSRLLGGIDGAGVPGIGGDSSVSAVYAQPVRLASGYAAAFPKVTLLLKGPTTLVTDGERIYLTDAGCAGMATAGSGDVLSGVLTALLSYIDDLTLAAAVGAHINGRAGEAAQRCFGAVSMTAGDTVAALPEVFKAL
ncbi:MAG: NAD(P)H-hydrate dehydratase [Lachnospiraceae bacterium]|nr:NAD(P)H-hydrate dehydratase [Lachnospiraceae bacterium]